MKFIHAIIKGIFGCRHPQTKMSRPFTTGTRTYMVCFHCGTERDYDPIRGRYLSKRELRRSSKEHGYVRVHRDLSPAV